MNNRNTGKGYPESIAFSLFGVAFALYWIDGAYKGGMPFIGLIGGGIALVISTVGFINSIKTYIQARKSRIHDMTGSNPLDEKWEKVYTSPNKTVYKKGGMTFTSKGSSIVGLVSGVFIISLAVKNLVREFSGGNTGSSRFGLILVLIASAVRIVADFRRLLDSKQDKQDMIDRMQQEENMRQRRRNSKSMRYFTEKDWETYAYEDKEITFYCPYCDGRLEQSFDYCPHCGNSLHK